MFEKRIGVVMTYDIEMTPTIKSRAKFLKFIPTNTIVSGEI
ncbi:MAG TPA: hypothetical protein VMW36_11510 [Patescibacteria group bacterium]|nr:hypothetical protein [Patescibacteria group bacterium]